MVFNYDIFQTLGVIKLYRVQEKGWSQLFSSGAWCPLKKVACSQNVVTSNPSALKALFSLALLSTWPPCDGGVLGWAKKTTVTGFVLEIMFIHTFYCLLGKNICNESVIPSLSPWLSFGEEKSL